MNTPGASQQPVRVRQNQSLAAFDAAVEAYAHAEESIQTLIGLFQSAFEDRFASRPEDLAWGQAIFTNLNQRMGGDLGLLDRSDDLVAAAADALDAFGANWSDERGIKAADIAKAGGIVCAVCNAMAQQRRQPAANA